jgi:hypothetical protein
MRRGRSRLLKKRKSEPLRSRRKNARNLKTSSTHFERPSILSIKNKIDSPLIFSFAFKTRYLTTTTLSQGGGVQKVAGPKLTKLGEPLFHALKHTHGFLGFITWVCFYDSFEKMCTAQCVCEDLGWVLRYGKDKAAVEKDLKRKAESPEIAHSLTTPLGFVSQRTKRSLNQFQVKTVSRKGKKSSSKRGGKNEAEKVRKIIESDQVQRDLIKRDIVVLQFEMEKKSQVRK